MARVRRVIATLLLVASGSASGETPVTAKPPDATAEVRHTVDTFLRAFEALDWPAFRSCFAEGATVFHPAPPNVLRTDSSDSFERAWMGVFERIRRDSGRTEPPYMTLAPRDLRIQLLSGKTALVTFHLPQGETIGRRTVILEKLDAGWKIVHIHASNLSRPAPVSTTANGK